MSMTTCTEKDSKGMARLGPRMREISKFLERRRRKAIRPQRTVSSQRHRNRITQNANHMYIYDPAGIHSRRVHVPPWVTQGQTTTIAGPFINRSDGGDVQQGHEVYIITVNDRNMRHPD
jgi:hypothetical protein